MVPHMAWKSTLSLVAIGCDSYRHAPNRLDARTRHGNGEGDDVGFRMIQMNPEIIARVAKDLETVRKLRKAESRIERVSAKVTAKINKTMRDA